MNCNHSISLFATEIKVRAGPLIGDATKHKLNEQYSRLEFRLLALPLSFFCPIRMKHMTSYKNACLFFSFFFHFFFFLVFCILFRFFFGMKILSQLVENVKFFFFSLSNRNCREKMRMGSVRLNGSRPM